MTVRGISSVGGDILKAASSDKTLGLGAPMSRECDGMAVSRAMPVFTLLLLSNQTTTHPLSQEDNKCGESEEDKKLIHESK